MDPDTSHIATSLVFLGLRCLKESSTSSPPVLSDARIDRRRLTRVPRRTGFQRRLGFDDSLRTILLARRVISARSCAANRLKSFVASLEMLLAAGALTWSESFSATAQF